MFLNLGSKVKVEDLIRGIIVQSGNDACIAIAEGISGSEDLFCRRVKFIGKRIRIKKFFFY